MLIADNIPIELKQLDQWVVWGVPGKPLKCPFNPKTMTEAKAGRPESWGSFALAAERVQCGKARGIGFEFHNNGYYGIDLDKVLEGRTIIDEARYIFEKLDSYTEISPSGTGLHIIVKAGGIVLDANRNGYLEIYNKGRYFTFTGDVYQSPKTIRERTVELQHIYQRFLKPVEKQERPDPTIMLPPGTKSDEEFFNTGLKRDKAFISLWNGDRPNGNESADDLALFNKLAYWGNGDTALMAHKFFDSPHYAQKDGAHKKKCRRDDYIQRTVNEAIAGLSSTAREDYAHRKPDQAQMTFSAPQSKDAKEPEKRKLKVTRLSDIKPKNMTYLLYPYIPAGTFTIIAGVGGSTKTWYSLYLAALVSNGGEFITDSPFESKRKPAAVIYQSKENDYETVIRPRLDALGANLDNILVIDDRDEDENGMPLTLSDGRIEEAIKEYKPALLIFDPMQSYLGDDIDMHRANEVRPVLDKIIEIGSRYNCAIVIIMHLSKMTSVGALDRILGSVDFRSAARSVLIVGSDPEDKERRVVAHAKFNNGKLGESIAYRISDKQGVVIEGFCDLDEDMIVQSRKKESRDKPSVSLDEAVSFLYAMVADTGYAKLDEIKRCADDAGISKTTLYRAKNELALKKLTLGFSQKTTWWYDSGVDKDELKQKLERKPGLTPAQAELSSNP